MKILMLIYKVMRQPLGNRVRNEEIALLEKGYQVKAIKCRWKGNEPEIERLKDIEIENLKFKMPETKVGLIFYLPIFYVKCIPKLMRENFDMIYCQHLLMLPVALFVAKMKGTKIVYDAYEMYSIDFSNYVPYFSEVLKKIIEFFENKLTMLTDCIITIDSVNNFLANRYRRFNKNVCVLYNVPDSEPKIDLEKFRKLQEKYKGVKLLIYVGGINKSKGFRKALEALILVKKQISNVKLLLIGSLDNASEKDSLEYIRTNGIEKDVEIIPWLPYGQMFRYLKIAHIGLALYQPVGHFLLVSRGNGRKFFTYMQAGLPVVGPDFGEIGLVVKEEKCGILVDTTDPREIANAIIYLLEHPEEAKAMGERGKKAVEEKYNWEIEKSKLIKLYKSLLKDLR